MIRTLMRSVRIQELQTLLKPFVIFMVLLFSMILGRQATPRLIELILMGIVALLGITVLLRMPALGVIILIPVTLFVQWELDTGTRIPINATILLGVAVVGIWLLTMVVIRKEVRLYPSRVNLPALLFLVGITASLIIGNLQLIVRATEKASLPAQVVAWMLYALSITTLLVVGNLISDIRWLQALVWVFLALGGVVVLGRILPSAPITRYVTEGSGGSVFWTLLIAFAYGQLIFNRSLHYGWRVLLGILIVATLSYSWFVQREWISGWLPPITAIFIITWMRSWRLGLAITLVGLIAVVVFFPSLYAEVMTPTQQYSAESRTATWPIMLELIKASPILGLGPANYYYYTRIYPLYGYFVYFNSHNNYIDIVAQMGIVGLGLFIWLMAELARLGLRLIKRVQDGFSLGYIHAALGALGGILLSGMLADWFLPFLYNIGMPGFRASILAWIFLGGLISIDRISRSEQDKPV